MADRNDYRGSWSGGGDDRWRRGDEHRQEHRRRERWGGREERSFRGGHGEEEREPWRRDRYGSLYDQDRTNYGSGWDRDRGDYGRGQDDDRRPREDYRQTWRPGGGAPYGDMELNTRSPGYEQFGAPHDYAYHPHSEFDPDYLHWRDEQLRLHDRDYQEWRRQQHQQYDDEYRRFRSERREGFGRSFQEWRSQRNMTGGMAQQHITPETHDYARRTAAGFGHGQDRPSGSLEPPGALTGRAGAGGSSAGGPASGDGALASGDTEFGKTPPQVQAATDGDRRTDEKDKKDDERRS